MDSTQENAFSASSSAIGYLYQCRYALLEAVRRLRRGEEFSVLLETLDDVVFEKDGYPQELIQTKHHLSRSADLSDASVDLWKSLRIWSDNLQSGAIDGNALHYLVTTSGVADSSAAALLKPTNSRNPSQAHNRLLSTANSSTNSKNRLGYDAFRALTDDQRFRLVDSIYVIGRAPAIEDAIKGLREAVFFAVEKKYLEPFLERLEGWWFRRCIRHLTRKELQPISSEELDAQMTFIREQFRQDNLPIDDDILEASIDASGYHDHTFVHQLRLIEAGNKQIVRAIQNYFRAFQQRSRWVRDDLVGVGELERYERRLIEEWEIYFGQMDSKLGGMSTEGDKLKAAQELYAWVETRDIPIRAQVTHACITRGSYHMLSDKERVGWHLEFVERLRLLLESKEVTS